MVLCQFIVTFYVLLLLVTQSLNQSNAQSAPIITRVTGCLNQGNHTLDCDRPARLTIYGTNFFSGITGEPYPTNLLSFEADAVDQKVTMTPRNENANDTYLEIDMGDYGYSTLPQQQLFNVRLTNQRTKLTSAEFAGFSLRQEAVPTVESVSGCRSSAADGKTAFNCDVVNDRITLMGSGFTSIAKQPAILRLGSQSYSYDPVHDNQVFLVFNDTTIVVSFNLKYLLLSLDAQNGVPQPLTLMQTWRWSTDPVWVQFTSLPQPVITSITYTHSSEGCNLDSSTDQPRFRDCVAGVSSVNVYGRYLLQGSKFFVGDIEATLSQIRSEDTAEVFMPIHQFAEGIFYDLRVTTTSGAVTWPPTFEFNTDPVITSVTPCVAPLRGSEINHLTYPHCMPGERFQISVMNVKNPILPRVLFTFDGNSSNFIECDNAVMVTSTSLWCTMPPQPASINEVDLTVEWASGEKTQTLPLFLVWDPVGSPRITTISGCYSTSGDPLHVNQCVGSSTTGAVLTLSGYNLAGVWTVNINLGTPAVSVVFVDNTTIICSLPPPRALMLPLDVMFPITISARSKVSNAAYVTYVAKETRDATHTSSSSSVMVISVATVFSVVGAVLIGVAAIVMARRARKVMRQPSEYVSEVSSTGNHVELSEMADV
jgi:hypothetical protein